MDENDDGAGPFGERILCGTLTRGGRRALSLTVASIGVAGPRVQAAVTDPQRIIPVSR